MNIAILSVSEKGKDLSSRLKILLDEDPTIIKINTFHKNVKDNINTIFNDKFNNGINNSPNSFNNSFNNSSNNSFNNNFSNPTNYDAIIGIMATGILIRNIADKLQDKSIDPAILSMDDSGKYVISLVSGHLGGANEFAKKIAELIESEPVITTATDTNDKIGIDTIANKLHWEILNKNEILYFNKAILEEKPVKLYINVSNKDEIRYKHYIKDYLKNQENNTLEIIDLKNRDLSIENIQATAFSYSFEDNIDNIDHQNNHHQNNQNNQNRYNDFDIIASFDDHRMFFKPKRLVLGIGSRANIPKNKVIEAIQIAMDNLELPIERIDSLATIEIKKDEKGILEAVKEINKPLNIVTINQIKEFKHPEILNSIFVQEKFDIPGVAEPAALIVAESDTGNSKLVHKKIAIDGVTVAVAISV